MGYAAHEILVWAANFYGRVHRPAQTCLTAQFKSHLMKRMQLGVKAKRKAFASIPVEACRVNISLDKIVQVTRQLCSAFLGDPCILSVDAPHKRIAALSAKGLDQERQIKVMD